MVYFQLPDSGSILLIRIRPKNKRNDDIARDPSLLHEPGLRERTRIIHIRLNGL